MKLLTYKRQLDSEQIFGFKMDDSIINIYDSSKFINEKLKDEKLVIKKKSEISDEIVDRVIKQLN